MRGDERDFSTSERRGETKQDRMDLLIDTALRSYSEPVEIPDTRVAVARLLDRAHAERAARMRVWACGWAAAVACAALLAVVVGGMRMGRAPRAPEIAWTPKAPGTAELRKGAGSEAPSPLKSRAVRLASCPDTKQCGSGRTPGAADETEVQLAASSERRRLPKLDVFPTPQPLTPQEVALVNFAQHGPPEVQRAILNDQKHWDDPIIVANLEERPSQASNPPDQ